MPSHVNMQPDLCFLSTTLAVELDSSTVTAHGGSFYRSGDHGNARRSSWASDAGAARGGNAFRGGGRGGGGDGGRAGSSDIERGVPSSTDSLIRGQMSGARDRRPAAAPVLGPANMEQSALVSPWPSSSLLSSHSLASTAPREATGTNVPGEGPGSSDGAQSDSSGHLAASSTDSLINRQPWHNSPRRQSQPPPALRPAGRGLPFARLLFLVAWCLSPLASRRLFHVCCLWCCALSLLALLRCVSR